MKIFKSAKKEIFKAAEILQDEGLIILDRTNDGVRGAVKVYDRRLKEDAIVGYVEVVDNPVRVIRETKAGRLAFICEADAEDICDTVIAVMEEIWLLAHLDTMRRDIYAAYDALLERGVDVELQDGVLSVDLPKGTVMAYADDVSSIADPDAWGVVVVYNGYDGNWNQDLPDTAEEIVEAVERGVQMFS